MLSATQFHELVSGRRRGVAPALLRGALGAAELPYRWAIGWRNRRYDQSHTVERVAVPVVSVGNLTLGGTGKTPLVQWIARWCCDRRVRLAIVSRGYGAAAGHQNDEARELAATLPEVPHLQNSDRVAAAREAIRRHDCQLVLLDDGFQHRRLARDLDIVLLDALEPFGFERVFPRGLLREPVEGLRRAAIVCLSRADAVDADTREAIRRRVVGVAPQAAWCELAHRPSGLVNAAGETRPLAELQGRRVAAFCGIGNPAGFRHTLQTAGCEVVDWKTLADHHEYTPSDLAALGETATRAAAELVLCTRKDLVKIGRNELGERPLWAVAIEIDLVAGRDALEAALAAVTVPTDSAAT